jgi:hypothetical protein
MLIGRPSYGRSEHGATPIPTWREPIPYVEDRAVKYMAARDILLDVAD